MPVTDTDEESKTRRTVRALAGLGVERADIARILGLTVARLTSRYRKDMAAGVAEANAKVAESLYKQAIGGNVQAAIFWMSRQKEEGSH